MLAADKLSPRGPERLDALFAMLAALLANCHRPRKRKPYKLTDFLLDFDTRPAEPASIEEIHAYMRSLTAALGGKVIPRGNDR